MCARVRKQPARVDLRVRIVRVRVRGRGRGRGRSMGEYYELLRQVREYRVSTPHHTKLVIVPWRLLELYSLY